jgi:hypothetical protein
MCVNLLKSDEFYHARGLALTVGVTTVTVVAEGNDIISAHSDSGSK